MYSCEFCNRKCKSKNAKVQHELWCVQNPNLSKEELEQKRALFSEYSKKANHSNRKIIYVCCTHCFRVIDAQMLGHHYMSKSCNDYINKSAKQETKTECLYCGKIPRTDPEYHLSICRKNPNNKKGLVWSEERKKKHSETMKAAVRDNPDSYSKNNVCGRIQIYEYRTYRLKGTWELITAKWLDSINIKWEYEVNPQPYFWENEWHSYFPDFYLPEYDVYIEVKGYKTERDRTKWDQFNKPLIIIDNTNIFVLSQYQSIDELYKAHQFQRNYNEVSY